MRSITIIVAKTGAPGSTWRLSTGSTMLDFEDTKEGRISLENEVLELLFALTTPEPIEAPIIEVDGRVMSSRVEGAPGVMRVVTELEDEGAGRHPEYGRSDGLG